MKSLLLVLGLLLFSASFSAVAATCNETCSVTGNCDSTCPVCIGTCISCYEIGTANACLDAATGGSTNCQWDGQQCKAITDVPSMPTKLWFLLLIPLFASVVWVIRRRRAIVR